MMVEFVFGAIGFALVLGIWLCLILAVCALLPVAYGCIEEFRKKMRGEE